MPVIPNLPERLYMLRLNRGPGPMLDLLNGMALEAALTGQELGIFESLEDEPAGVGLLADRLDASEDGLEVLLAYLSKAGYVSRDGGTYRLTELSRKWFIESSPTSYARYFRFWREVLYPFWRDHAAEAIREGRPPQTVYEWLDAHPDRWPVAQAAFELTAELLGDTIANAVDLPAGGRLLDVGGGHARYSVAFCEHDPSLRATVLDDAAVADIARENIAAAGLGDRVRFRRGDYRNGIPGAAYDGALLFNVVHGHDPETNRQLLRTVADATKPGGTLAVLDQFGDRTGPSIADTGTRFLDLAYLVSLGGRTYTTERVGEWLSAAGFEIADTREFRDRHMTLLVAERVGEPT